MPLTRINKSSTISSSSDMSKSLSIDFLSNNCESTYYDNIFSTFENIKKNDCKRKSRQRGIINANLVNANYYKLSITPPCNYGLCKFNKVFISNFCPPMSTSKYYSNNCKDIGFYTPDYQSKYSEIPNYPISNSSKSHKTPTKTYKFLEENLNLPSIYNQQNYKNKSYSSNYNKPFYNFDQSYEVSNPPKHTPTFKSSKSFLKANHYIEKRNQKYNKEHFKLGPIKLSFIPIHYKSKNLYDNEETFNEYDDIISNNSLFLTPKSIKKSMSLNNIYQNISNKRSNQDPIYLTHAFPNSESLETGKFINSNDKRKHNLSLISNYGDLNNHFYGKKLKSSNIIFLNLLYI
uniref:Uncharacterized protein n=1 Tax=Strongyloides venezuelensis TaxID=75913 RepID=A0A0K0FJZ7_STRVS